MKTNQLLRYPHLWKPFQWVLGEGRVDKKPQEIDTEKLMDPVVLPDMGIWHPSLSGEAGV